MNRTGIPTNDLIFEDTSSDKSYNVIVFQHSLSNRTFGEGVE